MTRHANEYERADHYRDERKHDTDPLPLHLEPAPIAGALEIAILAQAIPLRQAADLIQQYADTVAAGAMLDAVELTSNRIMAAIESPLPRRWMSPGECAYCDAHRAEPMMPSHTPSERCESGKRPHCTCDICF